VIPSLFPLFDITTRNLNDGAVIAASSFCRKAISAKPECRRHYDSLKAKPEGYHQCPFGMTSRNFYFDGALKVITGVIAFPRFDSQAEQNMAKKFPEIKVSRDTIEKSIRFLRETEKLKAAAVQEATQVLPQAFHELRKLNGAIIQHAEKEISERGDLPGLITIRSAAELMRNNFDILEALSNIEGMKALPTEATISLLDLTYKTMRVLDQRASSRGMHIHVDGVKAIIRGNQKSFPIVPAVLLENAIKYGRERSVITADVSTSNNRAVLVVKNETDYFIDPDRCFERGVRFSNAVEGGGFGLFLAKEIVLSHNGTIRCDSLNGKIEMIVTLPLVKVGQQK